MDELDHGGRCSRVRKMRYRPSPSEAPSSQPSPSASSRRLVPWLIAVAFFMESLDTTILNTAVPTIAAALHVAPLSMKSVLASYTLSLAVFHSDQRLDGRPVRNAPRVRLRNRNLHAGFVSLRHIEQDSCAGCLPHSAGLRRLYDGARRPTHHSADVRQIRTGPRHELRSHPSFDWPYARTHRWRTDRRILSLEIDFLREYSDWPRWFDAWFTCTCRTIAKNTPILSMWPG